MPPPDPNTAVTPPFPSAPLRRTARLGESEAGVHLVGRADDGSL